MDVNAGIPDSNQPSYGEGSGTGDKDKRAAGKPQFDLGSKMSAVSQRWAALRTEALSKWYPILREISLYLMPKRGFFEGQMPNWGTRIDHKRIMDSAPRNHLRTLASGLMSGLSDPSKLWFRLEIDDPEAMKEDDAKAWLENATKKTHRAFQESDIYSAFYSGYEEVAGFGVNAFILLENAKTVVRPRTFTAGEYFLGRSAEGVVNAFARQFWMTGGQLIKQFGYDNCSANVQSEYNSNILDTWHLVYHLIEENDDRIPGLRDAQNMDFRSIYWEANVDGNTRALLVSGFEEFPVIASRWDFTTTADVYGNGPGWDVLGDVKTLYKLVKKYLEAVDKVVDPPMVADAGVVVNTLPGGLTRASSQAQGGVKAAYQINPDLPAIERAMDRLTKKIGDGFFADFFLMIANAGRDMTAEEVMQRQGEKLLMLGPIIHRLTNEMHRPAIERTFKILVRSKALPPPPPSIAGRQLQIKYISMLAQAQQMSETAVLEQFNRFVGNLAAAKPEVLDNVDFDEEVRVYAERIGLPAKILASMASMAAMRAARAKQQQTAAAAQNAQAAASTAKVMADTKLGGGTALASLLGNGTPPPGGVA
jgi:hypothetical protein